jgi:colanic acid/amylovoran biosynthesis glycosyltransferase
LAQPAPVVVTDRGPAGPLSVCHVIGKAGFRSETWVDAQILGARRYAGRLWTLRPAADPYCWRTPATTLAAVSPAHLLANKTQGLLIRRGRDGQDAARLLRPLSVYVHRRRPDVFHAHFGPNGYSWSTLARTTRVPLVTSFYGYDASQLEYQRPPWTARYRRFFAMVGAVLVEGPAMAERVARLGCPPEKLHVVRLPFTNVDVDVERPPAGERPYTAVLGGRMVEKKGFDLGLRAFARAFPAGDERLLVVGDGPEEQRIRALAAELGLAERVEFRSPVPLDEFAALAAGAEVALFPSRTAQNGDGEGGAPLTLTLMQAIGVPVVVSDHDDLPWASAPGTPVVPSGNVDELAGALHATVDESRSGGGVLDARVAAARRFVAEAHDGERLAGQREAVYDAVRAGP